MMQRGFAGLLGLGAALIGAIAFALASAGTDGVDMVASMPRPSSTPPNQAAAPVQGESRQALADGLLARPLFAAIRRPPITPAAPPAPRSPNPPRLAGILVNGGRGRSAIFAAVGDGRSVVVQEGTEVGGYTVQLIEARQVTLSGPGGQRMLRPTFDTQPQSATNGPAGAVSAAGDTSPFAPATEVMQSLRDLPGFSGIAVR